MQIFRLVLFMLKNKIHSRVYLLTLLFGILCMSNIYGQTPDSIISKKADFILEVSTSINFPETTEKANYRIGILGKGKEVKILCELIESNYAELDKGNVSLEVLQFKKTKTIVPVDLMYVTSESKIRISELNTKLGTDPYVIVTENFPFGTSLLNFAMDDKGDLFFELQDQAFISRGARIEKTFLNSSKRAISEEEWSLRLQGAVKMIEAQEVIIDVQDKELVVQDGKISNQRSILTILLLSLIIISTLSILAIRMMRQKNKVLLELAEKNKSIINNVNYARNIQDALLPDISLLSSFSQDNFLWYQPKEIVSGDFHWIEEIEDKAYFAVADCTGHGVPGAFLSVMCINALTKAVKELKVKQPALVLDETVNILAEYFEKSNNLLKEGMDVALCCYNKKTELLEYSGANNALYHVSNGKLTVIKPDKQPIGRHFQRKKYTNHTVPISKGDCIYMFTDGVIDQFGGPDDKKFGSRRFQQILLKNRALNLSEQKEELVSEFTIWMDEQEQLDDICMLALKF